MLNSNEIDNYNSTIIYNDDTSKFKNSIEDKAAWVKRKCSQSYRNEKEKNSVGNRSYRKFLNQSTLLLLCHSYCPCCNNELDYSSRQEQNELNIDNDDIYWRKHIPAIDRIDSTLNYQDNNVQILCQRCNMIKGDANAEDVMRVAIYLSTLNNMKKPALNYVNEMEK